MAKVYEIVGYDHGSETFCIDCVGDGGRENPIFAGDEFEVATFCFTCSGHIIGETRHCFVDGAMGIYCAQQFARRIHRAEWTGIDQETFDILMSGPDHEHYYDAWDDVLRFAEFKDAAEQKWRVEQDGDVFLVLVTD